MQQLYLSSFITNQRISPNEQVPNNLLLLTSTASTTQPNNINLLQLTSSGLRKIAQQKCQYPVTGLEGRILSNINSQVPCVLTSSDALRLFQLQKINSTYKFEEVRKVVGNARPSPIISMSWSKVNQQLVAYSTFDTLIQIHDLENNKQLFSGQLHDKASNSVQFDNTNENILFSAGTDGTLVQFDQRLQNKSLTLFKGPRPLLKVKQNSQDPNILAFIQHGSHIITLLDRRQPEKCIINLDKHQSQVTSIDWHPNHPEYLLSTSVDEHCYIFDIVKQKAILEYKAGDICQHCQWGSNDLSDWVSITWSNQVEILRTGL